MTTLASRLQFMESQAAYIESRARMIQHGSIQYPSLVGIERSASPFADVITYYSWDGTGDMIDLANRANDYPFVEVTQAQHNVPIEWKGLAYDYSDREVGRAMLTGVPLSDRKSRIAFRIWEEIKDDVFINGDSAKGWDGFINVANVASPNASRHLCQFDRHCHSGHHQRRPWATCGTAPTRCGTLTRWCCPRRTV